jgi:hypothetical protein
LRREPQPHLPLILRVTLPGQVSHGLHTFQQRSERAPSRGTACRRAPTVWSSCSYRATRTMC